MTTEPFARNRSFWDVLGRAALVGFLAGCAALAFNTVVKRGTDLIRPEEINRTIGRVENGVFRGGTMGVVSGHKVRIEALSRTEIRSSKTSGALSPGR